MSETSHTPRLTFVSTTRLAATAFGLAVVLLLTSAAFTIHRGAGTTTPQGRSSDSVSSLELANPGDLSSAIASLQTRLQRLPNDSGSWASLGTAYIQQARVTGDPSYYAKASGALRRSLREQPRGNALALTGQAALAAARHQFGHALALARQSQRINSYSSVNQGMLVDALVELGHYQAATQAVQRMIDLKPAVPSYARVSYLYELRGNLAGARYAMRSALNIAYSTDDKAFAYFELGELAWNAGNVNRAQNLYQQGIEQDPAYVPLLDGIAKVEAAKGQTTAALRDYQTVVDRYPSPTYVIEFADLLTSLGMDEEAAQQGELIRAQEKLFSSAGVNLDLEQSLYDANHGRPQAALVSAHHAFVRRQGIFVEDAYAWALHVNGRDRAALRHSVDASRLGTRSALIIFHRGMIEHALGNDAAAADSLRTALRINPHFSPIFVPQARDVLAQLSASHR